MGLVQRCGMEDNLNPAHAMHCDGTLRYRADISRKRRVKDIDSHHLVIQIPQGSNQGLAQVTGTSRNQEFHDRFTRMHSGDRPHRAYASCMVHGAIAASPGQISLSTAIQLPPLTSPLPQKRYSENHPTPSYTEEKTWSGS
jgi:hypothetical protein